MFLVCFFDPTMCWSSQGQDAVFQPHPRPNLATGSWEGAGGVFRLADREHPTATTVWYGIRYKDDKARQKRWRA